MGEVLSIVFVLAGIYCVVCGITKKGMMYDSPKVLDENRELFIAESSRILFIMGPALTLAGVLEIVKAQPLYYGICYGVALVASVMFSFKINKYARRVK